MSSSQLSLLLLGLAAVPFAILWFLRHSHRDGWMYFLASITILLCTASLLVWAPTAYNALGGRDFMPESLGKGAFDSQSYSGFLQILFGVPVAVAGSLYAILLARQSERQSSLFNAYEIRKNFRDRLEKRTSVLGRLAKSLRDLNNTAFILLARVEGVLEALPLTEEGRDAAVARIGRESAELDEGLQMLRAVLGDYRDATIAVREAGINLDMRPRAPLDTIAWQFYERAAPGATASIPAPITPASPGADPEPTAFLDALLDRDYQAVADRFQVRAHQLGAKNMVRARLERMVHGMVRWSENASMRADWPDVGEAVIGGGLATPDIFGDTDHVGFRFIGPALIRADRAVDRLDLWKLRSRIDFGSAILIDAYLSLPTKQQSEQDIAAWDEWRFLETVVGKSERDAILESIPDRNQYFPKSFCGEVERIQRHYQYYEASSREAQAGRAAEVRQEQFALFHHMPPPWMDSVYDELASEMLGANPPLRQSLVGHMGCLAVAIHIKRLDGARRSSMHAIDQLLQSLQGAVERQFLERGAEGFDNWRRCLLITWVQQPARRADICVQLEAQLASVADPVHAAQLQLDLVDCYLAAGQDAQAEHHFQQARAYIHGCSDAMLAGTRWFAPSYLEDPASALSSEIVLFGLWMKGYLMKQFEEYVYQGMTVSETEVAMPQGWLPVLWYGMVNNGVITLASGAAPRIIEVDEQNFFGLIPPDPGPWHWEPKLVAAELQRLMLAGREDNTGFLDYAVRTYMA